MEIKSDIAQVWVINREMLDTQYPAEESAGIFMSALSAGGFS
jgi:hypothetical protein